MTRARKPKPGGARAGAGRPKLYRVRRTLPMSEADADAHDQARGDVPWTDWARGELAAAAAGLAGSVDEGLITPDEAAALRRSLAKSTR